MPATSKSQRRLMAMAEHATPEELASAGPAVQQVASSMSKDQLHDFSATREKGLPEHVHKKHHVHHKEKRGDGRSAGRSAKGRGDYEK